MVHKEQVGDYPLLDYPCKYWWVRYATACTFLSEQQDKLWEPKLKEMQEKYHFSGYSYSGPWGDLAGHRAVFDYTDTTLRVYRLSDHKDILVTNRRSELWEILRQIIESHQGWGDCPYQMEHQSKCPFYFVEESLKTIPLEELRKQKGYDLEYSE